VAVWLYHIAYSEESFLETPEGFRVLNNIENPRPDWREYWPIREFLLREDLEESSYYGFFSPRFTEKTGLTSKDIVTFVNDSVEADAITFSPQVDIGAFFLNVFAGGDLFEPGFLGMSQRFFDRIGLEVSLAELPMDSRTIVFSNFIVAKPRFWRVWMSLCEQVYDIAENADDGDILRNQLNAKTGYKEGVERKVFLIEGIASLILTIDDSFRVYSYNPYHLGWSEQLHKFSNEAVACDALKIAMKEQGYPQYREEFDRRSRAVLAKALSPRKENNMKQTPAHDKYNDTILDMLPRNLRSVVEVGCMRGSLAKVYGERNPACNWIGIDIDPDNVEVAKGVCAEALCLDIEQIACEDFTRWSKAEAWIFGDTLEHLRDPWSVLRNIRNVLPKGGVVIASIPNSQHWYFQARVNIGLFRYEDDGLFDRTHLRFFSRITILEMFQQCGFHVEAAVARNLEAPEMGKYLPHIRAMAAASGSDPDQAETDAKAFQYVVRATAMQDQP
jgi:2-polyprenyl-3-methyl-5-hydroxy-6-metoxy-1,4-benzoquinol methylase